MRLINAEIAGYGRLVKVKVNLDSKVIAVVGPNEAGKTTFLNALAFLNDDSALSQIARSRAVAVDGESSVVKANFVLDDDDRAALEHLDLEQPPLSISASRRADGGNVLIAIKPRPLKARAPLHEALSNLRSEMSRADLDALISEETVFGDPGSDAARDFKTELAELEASLSALADASEDTETEEIARLTDELAGALVDDAEADALRSALIAASAWLGIEDPSASARSTLWNRAPDFLLFDEDDRTLLSSYTLNAALLANIPNALANLARMGNLDLPSLESALTAGDVARRDTATNKSNKRLAELFKEAWKQSRLSVMFSVDGTELRVSIIENGENVTVFGERSAGLRMFVALVAFLAARDSSVPPILLIDEAENHLHIDAQADLVGMFVSQEQAARVIYTTHSPACLPPDLGVGIRAVVPLEGNQQVSEIRNSFWTGGAGYSPLMIAMGAAAAAFTAARFVVLAEGATEMILLPSLIRKATGLEILPYQVAPGLSEVPKDFYQSLDLEGAKVAYVLDGDAGGKALRKALQERGVPEERIVMIPAPGLENVLVADVYLSAVASLLREQYQEVQVPELPVLTVADESSWATQLSVWASRHKLQMPSKVAIANRLVEENKATPSDAFRPELVELHARLLLALGV